MVGRDDDPRQPRRVEQAFFLVEVPAARLLRHQPPLQPVGEARDDALHLAHLLVEIGAQAAELVDIAEFLGLDDFVEAGGEGFVVGCRLVGPVAARGARLGAVAAVLAGGRLLAVALFLTAL